MQVKVPNGDIVQNGYHDDTEPLTNGFEPHHDEILTNGHEFVQENGVHLPKEEEREGERSKWNFPPVLEDFDLMETEADPDELEGLFNDERYISVATVVRFYFKVLGFQCGSFHI